MARELELKFRLADKKKFLERLSCLGIILSEPIVQHDTIFFRKGKCFKDLESGEPVIRIRQEKDNVKATLKKYVNGIVDREEIECSISDAGAFTRFLCLLECSPVVTVKKTRAKGVYHGVTITLDSVEKLGDFTEIEIMSAGENVEENLSKICNIAYELGLDMADLAKIPYDEMLFKKGENND